MKYIEAGSRRIPALGFGTFRLDSADAYRMVRAVLDMGYRHIDTAQMYGNEEAVGRAIAESAVAREDVFLTTKVWPDRFRDGDLQASVDRSLERLDMDQVDLLLLHWPNPEVPLSETLDALQEVRRDGRARDIGVSNFPNALLRQALEHCGRGTLLTNQVEYHVFLSQREVLRQVREAGMFLTAYCPLAQGRVVGNAVLAEIGRRHGKNEAQVALRWLMQQGVAAVPRTRRESNARANLDIFDFELPDADMRRIDGELQGDGRMVDPGLAPAWDRP
ncbi:MAG TPA: aldo/keto reductase [Gammaproteobacteria bacterium]|nr:aldo/keto reductase [Gammaproteobacteria bacterium]